MSLCKIVSVVYLLISVGI